MVILKLQCSIQILIAISSRRKLFTVEMFFAQSMIITIFFQISPEMTLSSSQKITFNLLMQGNKVMGIVWTCIVAQKVL